MSTTNARLPAVVSAAEGLALAGVAMNFVAAGLSELQGAPRPIRVARVVNAGLIGGGAVLPLAALIALFVGTQSVEGAVTTAVVLVLGLVGGAGVYWWA